MIRRTYELNCMSTNKGKNREAIWLANVIYLGYQISRLLLIYTKCNHFYIFTGYAIFSSRYVAPMLTRYAFNNSLAVSKYTPFDLDGLFFDFGRKNTLRARYCYVNKKFGLCMLTNESVHE